MTDAVSPASREPDSSPAARIERALARVELRVRQLQAKAATAEADRNALLRLQHDVQGSLFDLDQMIASAAKDDARA